MRVYGCCGLCRVLVFHEGQEPGKILGTHGLMALLSRGKIYGFVGSELRARLQREPNASMNEVAQDFATKDEPHSPRTSTTAPLLRIAVDTGGTFTDVVLYHTQHHRWYSHKLLSTPDDPARAVLAGIRAIVAHTECTWESASSRLELTHGSTVATNALLEGKGARAAFVTTRGFEDTLHIARQNRPSLYALRPQRTPPPISRTCCLGVEERTAYNGAILRPLREQDVQQLAQKLSALGVEAIAISLLHSYANPAHEQQLARGLQKALPEIPLTLSHELLPELREYERGATCAANAVVAPRMRRYLGRLADDVGRDRFRIMASSGGKMTVEEVQNAPVHTVLSGPAGGVIGALATAAPVFSPPRIISFDMGGTSTDVSLCDGAPTLTHRGAVGPLPIRVPLIDIHTVGAGGGSIAQVDVGGALRVGPASCGADPGPACYGRQTGVPVAAVTDAHAVLGRLIPERFLGGAMTLDLEAARRAVAGVAAAANLSLEEAALGILRVAEATMVRALKVISIERGYDVRDFVLMCFGGAGGLHACHLAEALEIKRVFIPRRPGLLSAVGMLFAHNVCALSRSVMATLHGDERDAGVWAHVETLADELQQSALERLSRDGFTPEACHLSFRLDLRYAGQSHELSIPFSPGVSLQQVWEAFAAQHKRLYGYQNAERPLELVTVRLQAEGRVDSPKVTVLPTRGELPLVKKRVHAFFHNHREEGWSVERRDLLAGDELQGPCIITEYSSTTVIPRGWTISVYPTGGLLAVHHFAHSDSNQSTVL